MDIEKTVDYTPGDRPLDRCTDPNRPQNHVYPGDTLIPKGDRRGYGWVKECTVLSITKPTSAVCLTVETVDGEIRKLRRDDLKSYTVVNHKQDHETRNDPTDRKRQAELVVLDYRSTLKMLDRRARSLGYDNLPELLKAFQSGTI